jgi:hypothetical protein
MLLRYVYTVGRDRGENNCARDLEEQYTLENVDLDQRVSGRVGITSVGDSGFPGTCILYAKEVILGFLN